MIRKVKYENENSSNSTDPEYEDNSISTQEIIDDARFRRKNSVKEIHCEQCNYKTGSDTLMKRRNFKEHKTQAPPKSYTSKRISCKYCTKKFNKNATFEKHMKESHHQILKETQNIQNDSPNQTSNFIEVQPRVARQRRNKKTVPSA